MVLKTRSRPAAPLRAILPLLVLPMLVLLAGCMAAETTDPEPTGTLGQPPTASYDCGEDGTLRVDSLGSSVRVTGPDGVSTDLPAAPPDQRARFGGESQAIVVENGEALYMVSGKPVLTCRKA